MSQQIQISAVSREEVGTGASRRLRRGAERIPGIIYGGDADPRPLTLSVHELLRVMQNEAFHSQVLNVVVDGAGEQAVVRELQRDPASDKVLHIDFLRVRADRAIQVSVPLRYLNEQDCVGVRAGGNLSQNLIEVEVSCLPAHLPEFIEVDVGHLDMGETLHLSDLEPPEGVTIVALTYGEERNITVVSVQAPRGGAGDLDEETGEALEPGAEAPAGEEGESTPSG